VLIGQDGCQSIDLGDRTLFIFSDTLLLPLRAAPGATSHSAPFQLKGPGPTIFLANCAALTQGTDTRASLLGMQYYQDQDGFPVEILSPGPQEQADKLRFWPAHGIYVSGRVYLYYLGIQTVEESSIWAFKNLGAGLAIMDPQTGECQRVCRGAEWLLWTRPEDDFHFGVQVLEDAGFTYVFGSVRRGLDIDALLARVPTKQISDPTCYTYYQPERETWIPDLDQAGSLGPCGNDYSVSYNPYLGQYLMVFVNSYTKELKLRLAKHIEGPYSPAINLGRIPHRRESELIYLALEHPKFACQNGQKVYISYCQPYFTLASLVEVCFQ